MATLPIVASPGGREGPKKPTVPALFRARR